MALKESKLRDVDWGQLFQRIDAAFSQYPEKYVVPRGDLLAELRKKGVGIPEKDFDYWTGTLEFIQKTFASGGYPLYNLNELKKAYLAAYLRKRHDFNHQQIAVAVYIYASNWLNQKPALQARDLNEISRAWLILVGRFLGLISSLIPTRTSLAEDVLMICYEEKGSGKSGISRIASEEEVRRNLVPAESLIGWSREWPNGEIFPALKDLSVIERKVYGRSYFRLSVASMDRQRFFSIVLGTVKGSSLEKQLGDWISSGNDPITYGSREHQLLSRVLAFSFPTVANLIEVLNQQSSVVFNDPDANIIDVLLSVVLLASPEKWVKCAFFVEDEAGDLRPRAHSVNQLSNHRLNSGFGFVTHEAHKWVFNNKDYLLIERLLENAKRLDQGGFMSGGSHIFIPAIVANGLTAGVLHVVGSTTGATDQDCFSGDEVGLLYALARVIGEAALRASVAGVKDVSHAMMLHRIDRSGRSELKAQLAQVLSQRVALAVQRAKETDQVLRSYLGLFAIRIRGMADNESQTWYLDLICRRVAKYFSKYGFRGLAGEEISPIFQLGDDKLVVLMPYMTENVRSVREGLQKELDQISLINKSANIKIVVWSVDVPYEYLEKNFGITGLASQNHNESAFDGPVNYLIDRTEEAIQVIWHVKEADLFLQQRQFDNALARLNQAFELDPNNSYILRHISESHAGLRQYAQAKAAALAAIEADSLKNTDFASNHLRLADAHFGLGDIAEAQKEYQIAFSLSQKLGYREALAERLLIYGSEQDLKSSLRLLLELESQTDDKKHRSWIRQLTADVYLKLRNLDQAEITLKQALIEDPENPFLRWELIKINNYPRFHKD